MGAVTRPFVLLALVGFGLGLLGVSSAANRPLAGDLDPSFGQGGIVTHTVPGTDYPFVSGIALQPDGKIVVSGGSNPGDHGLLLARYMPAGSLDPTFGTGGYVETHFKFWAFADAIALQPDGKILIAGGSYDGNTNFLSELTLARYNPDGSLDARFGHDGITTTPVGGGPDPSAAAAYEIALLPSGKILVGGSVEYLGYFPSSAFVLARYTSDGLLDPSFGNGGTGQTWFLGDDRLGGFVVGPDGKIVAVGTARSTSGRSKIGLARYLPDGTLDGAFGNGGKLMTPEKGNGFEAYDLALQEGGKILVLGLQEKYPKQWPVLVRYLPGGALGANFGEEGIERVKRLTMPLREGALSTIIVQQDGNLLAAGNANLDGSDGPPYDVLARFHPNGTLDPSFGKHGLSMVALPNRELPRLALQGDGKILVGGAGVSEGQAAWAVARFLGGNNCVVPKVRGKRLVNAKGTLSQVYCQSGHVSRRFSSLIRRGRVIRTSPPRGTRLPGGSKVNLVVSKGRR